MHRKKILENMDEDSRGGACGSCGNRPCKWSCPCGTLYCGEECQRNDWIKYKHRRSPRHEKFLLSAADDAAVGAGFHEMLKPNKIDHACGIFFAGDGGQFPAISGTCLSVLGKIRVAVEKNDAYVGDAFDGIYGSGMGALSAALLAACESIEQATAMFIHLTREMFADLHKLPNGTTVPSANGDRRDFSFPQKKLAFEEEEEEADPSKKRGRSETKKEQEEVTIAEDEPRRSPSPKRQRIAGGGETEMRDGSDKIAAAKEDDAFDRVAEDEAATKRRGVVFSSAGLVTAIATLASALEPEIASAEEAKRARPSTAVLVTFARTAGIVVASARTRKVGLVKSDGAVLSRFLVALAGAMSRSGRFPPFVAVADGAAVTEEEEVWGSRAEAASVDMCAVDLIRKVNERRRGLVVRYGVGSGAKKIKIGDVRRVSMLVVKFEPSVRFQDSMDVTTRILSRDQFDTGLAEDAELRVVTLRVAIRLPDPAVPLNDVRFAFSSADILSAFADYRVAGLTGPTGPLAERKNVPAQALREALRNGPTQGSDVGELPKGLAVTGSSRTSLFPDWSRMAVELEKMGRLGPGLGRKDRATAADDGGEAVGNVIGLRTLKSVAGGTAAVASATYHVGAVLAKQKWKAVASEFQKAPKKYIAESTAKLGVAGLAVYLVSMWYTIPIALSVTGLAKLAWSSYRPVTFALDTAKKIAAVGSTIARKFATRFPSKRTRGWFSGKELESTKEQTMRRIRGDAAAISKWLYLMRGGIDDGTAWEDMETVGLRVTITWTKKTKKSGGERGIAGWKSEVVPKSANAAETFEPADAVARVYNDLFELYGCAENLIAPLKRDATLLKLFRSELAETTPMFSMATQYEYHPDAKVRAHRRDEARDGSNEREIKNEKFGGTCEWTYGNEIVPMADGNAVFSSVATALRNADACVCIAGWCIALGLALERDEAGGTVRLGELLGQCAARGVRVFLLAWNGTIVDTYSDVLEAWREGLSDDVRKMIQVRRITNPERGWWTPELSPFSHHQKIIIVDNSVAFIGGLDVANNRWDVGDHPCMPQPRIPVAAESGGAFVASSSLLNISRRGSDPRYTGFDYYSPGFSDVKDKITASLRKIGSGRLLSAKLAAHVLVSADESIREKDTWGAVVRREMISETAACAAAAINHPDLPRMPWHDVSLRIKGPAVGEIRALFHRRWRNARYGLPKREPGTTSLKSTFEVLPRAETYSSSGVPCLITQSLPMGGYGLAERTIKNAYIAAIATSRTHVYIEQQYFSAFANASNCSKDEERCLLYAYERVFGVRPAFVPSFNLGEGPAYVTTPYVGKTPLEQRFVRARDKIKPALGNMSEWMLRCGDTAAAIGSVLAWRLRKAAFAGEEFCVRVVVPAYPDGFGSPENLYKDTKSDELPFLKKLMLTTLALQYMSTWFLHETVLDALCEKNKIKSVDRPARRKEYEAEAARYFQVYCLRSHGITSYGFPVTEQIYPHVKCLITDSMLICGSANLNERSMSGNRDSEVAAVVPSRQIASETLRTLVEEHTSGVALRWKDEELLYKMNEIATENTELYKTAFDRAIPEADIESGAEFIAVARELAKDRETQCETVRLSKLRGVACANYEKKLRDLKRYQKSPSPRDAIVIAGKQQETAEALTNCKDAKEREARGPKCPSTNLERRFAELADVRGHATVAPRLWLRKDIEHIAGAPYEFVGEQNLVDEFDVSREDARKIVSKAGETFKTPTILDLVQ